MSRIDSLQSDALSAADRKIIEQALSALLRERSVAYEIAVDVANSHGLVQPDVFDFGLPDILRLRRAL